MNPAKTLVPRILSPRLVAQCVLGTALALTLTGATCDDTVADPATGNIDRLADAVLVTPDSSVFPRQTYVVLANPDLEQLRVFNAKTRVFERGPNAFFPLSVPTGPATLRLTTPVGRDGELYYLDSGEGRLQLVRVSTGADNFKRIGEGVRTGVAPVDAATVGRDDGTTRAFVALSDAGVVEVYDIDPVTGVGVEVTTIALPQGSRPSAIAIDPTGESVVVTDGALRTVSILTVDPPAFDRAIDVGGTSSGLSIGRVDPGDGLAPMALILRKATNQVAAIRLYRPGYREDRAMLLGSVELPDIPRVAYVPDQSESRLANPRVCCPLVVGADEPTFAWATVVTDLGELLYLRFDGARDDGREGQRGLFRLIDLFSGTPSIGPSFWSGADAAQPVLESDPLDNFGTPSFVPYLPPGGIQVTLTYEGRVLSARAADYIDNGEIALGGTGADIRVGDLLTVDVTNREGPCPETFERSILAISDGGVVDIGPLSDEDETCLNVGPRLSVDVRVNAAFTAISNYAGDLGRRVLDTDGVVVAEEQIQTPGFLVTLTAGDETPERDDVMVIDLASNSIPLSVLLSQNASSITNGFGRGGRLPASLVGGPVSVPGFVEGTFVGARRMYMASAAGLLIELNETETNINSIVSHQ